jgi:hypothetical protein
MRPIHCTECGKFLFNTDQDSPGTIGAIAQQKGFVYKNACLFSNEYSSLYFCNDQCGKAFYEKNIPSDPKMSKVIADVKTEIPEMARDVTGKMVRLVEVLNKSKNL